MSAEPPHDAATRSTEATAAHTSSAPSSLHARSAPAHIASQLSAALGVDSPLVLLVLTSLLALLLYRLVLRRALHAVGIGSAGSGRRRLANRTLLVGLPSSGKTALLYQLLDASKGEENRSSTSGEPAAATAAAAVTVPRTQTSMQANIETVCGGRITVVDYPGHRRLRAGLFPHLSEAETVIVVVDSVTIHDDRHEGAYALAELLLSVLSSPEFFGVRKLLFVCTKRDELTSYSAKAVQKLLEKAMAATLASPQGDLARVETVVDAKGTTVGRGKERGGGKGASARGRQSHHQLELDEHGGFSFEEQLGMPVEFVEVGCSILGTSDANKTFTIASVMKFLDP